jgi:hypothetical protein
MYEVILCNVPGVTKIAVKDSGAEASDAVMLCEWLLTF